MKLYYRIVKKANGKFNIWEARRFPDFLLKFDLFWKLNRVWDFNSEKEARDIIMDSIMFERKCEAIDLGQKVIQKGEIIKDLKQIDN